jgi:hypothetical protein
MKANPQEDARVIAAAAKRYAGQMLIAEADKIDREIAASRRPEPRPDVNRWAIDVRFQPRGKLYEFLVLRANGRYYTTGTTLASSVHESWAAFLQWLDEETAGHSAMIPLVSDYDEPAALEGQRWSGAGRI